jgi:tRNA threonylcarbamoyladenosine modification (KEOPS) complex Cgi121 subunit
MRTRKYITLIVRADDEKEARSLIPGVKIGPNEIVGVGLGDMMTLCDQFKELISEENQDKADELERISFAPWLVKTATRVEPLQITDPAKQESSPAAGGKP